MIFLDRPGLLAHLFYIFFFTLCNSPLSGQDYIAYQKSVDQADRNILSGEMSKAAQHFDTLYRDYHFIYAKHCIRALQVACTLNDSTRIAKWLEKCLLQGVPLWMLRANEITSKIFTCPGTKPVTLQVDSLQQVYFNSIDRVLAKTIDSLLVIDQKFTDKVNDGFNPFRGTIYHITWVRNNRRQFEILKKIISEYGFPGEKLIGLPAPAIDSAQAYGHTLKNGPEPFDYRAYTMLVHYFSDAREVINELLLEQVVQGNLPPWQYGGLNDFLARYSKGYPYYNVWHQDPAKENIPGINARRDSIGLNTFGEQQAHRKLKTEWFRNGQLNQVVLIE